jgi:phage terminase small subunit
MPGAAVKRKARKSPEQPAKPRELTTKQAEFVRQYLVDHNATSAAIRAGYGSRNAHKIGSELLGKPGVITAISKAITARAERTEVTADWVVQRLAVEATDRSQGSQPSARVKALELLAKHLGMMPGDLHLHRHDHAAPKSPEAISLSSQQVIDKLSLEAKLAVLEAVRQARQEASAKLLPAPTEVATPGAVITVAPESQPESPQETHDVPVQ